MKRGWSMPVLALAVVAPLFFSGCATPAPIVPPALQVQRDINDARVLLGDVNLGALRAYQAGRLSTAEKQRIAQGSARAADELRTADWQRQFNQIGIARVAAARAASMARAMLDCLARLEAGNRACIDEKMEDGR